MPLIAGFLLAGCVDQKKEVSLYRKVLDAQVLAPTTRPIAPDDPLPLSRAMALANQNYEPLGVRGETYVQALIDKDRAFAAFLPTIGLGPQFSWEDTTGAGGGGAFTLSNGTTIAFSGGSSANHHFDVPAEGSYNLFNGFRDTSNLNRAGAAIEQQKQSLLDLQQTVLLDVVQTYYQVLRSEESVRVLENSLQVQEEHVRDQRARYQLGSARALDVAQSESQAAQTRVSLIQARTDVRNGRSMLEFLIGVPAATNPLLDDYNPPSAVAPRSDWLALAESHRQDLRSAVAATDAARYNVTSAYGAFLPSVTLDVSYFLYRESTPTSLNWTSLLSANVPIFTGGLLEANLRTAWSEFRQAVLTESQTLRQIRQDIQQGYENLMSSEAQIAELQRQVAAARASLELSDRSYQAGLATNLDRLTAQNDLLTAQLNLVTQQFQRKINYLNLLRTAGELTIGATVPTSQPSTAPTTELTTPSALTEPTR